MVLIQSFHHLVTVASPVIHTLVIHKFIWPICNIVYHICCRLFSCHLDYFIPGCWFQLPSLMVVDSACMVKTPRFLSLARTF